MLNLIPEDYKKHLLDIKTISSDYDNSQLVILKLSRDQHLRFKNLAPLVLNETIQSMYVEHNGKFFHIGGKTHIVDKMNSVFYNVAPISVYSTSKYASFYKKLFRTSPVGKTRNAIILHTHCGLIPAHMHRIYNRLYCIDDNRSENKESILNLKLNKINNCMSFEMGYKDWIYKFNKHEYTPPGKRNRIGLIILDAAVIDEDTVMELISIKPETIILHSEDLDKLEALTKRLEGNEDFRLTLADKSDDVHFRRIKNQNESKL